MLCVTYNVVPNETRADERGSLASFHFIASVYLFCDILTCVFVLSMSIFLYFFCVGFYNINQISSLLGILLYCCQ